MKKRSIEVLAGVVLASGVAVAGGNITNEESAVEPFAPVAKVEKKADHDHKGLKHFHEPFCMCNLSPLFTSHKYDGKVHGYLRVHHILDGDSNGFDKNTGSTLGFGLKYDRHLIGGLSGGVEYYGVTDTGLTNENKYIAFGQFMDTDKSPNQDYGDMWGAHLIYKADSFRVSLARSQFDSPMTKIQITHVPNMYEFARIDANLLGADLSLSYITRMAYGSRSAADFGLIGEGTGTAGMGLNPFKDIERGKYTKISDLLGDDAGGVVVLGARKTFENFKMELWDFYIQDTLNTVYAEMEYPFYTDKGYGAAIHLQYLNQSVEDKFDPKSIYGGNFYGVKLSTKMKKLKVNFSYNKKDDTGGFLNVSGANPGFTSSIFSRNEYRTGVSAYKITAMYPIMKGLKVIASYADYGQSDMTLKRKGLPALASQTDATEANFVLAYKPMKNLTFKLFNANRTSEFSTAKKERKQHQTRLIVNYDF